MRRQVWWLPGHVANPQVCTCPLALRHAACSCTWAWQLYFWPIGPHASCVVLIPGS